jgi:hypothetical protein
MGFRDTRPRASVRQVLTGQLARESLWPEKGPTDRAVPLFEVDGGTRSSSERAAVAWNGMGEARLSEIPGLDAERLDSLRSRSTAVASSSEIDRWVWSWSKTPHLEGLSPHT